jgi:LAGLIDADG endonuclease
VAVNRPEYFFYGIPDPFWIAGFTSGDGYFHIVLRNSDHKTGVFARFSIHLHVIEKEVLKGVANYFKLYNTEIYNSTKIKNYYLIEKKNYYFRKKCQSSNYKIC